MMFNNVRWCDMLSCGVVGCGVAWWDMVVCAYIYMCVYVCVSVVHDTRYDMTFQIKQKSISLTTAVTATNRNKKLTSRGPYGSVPRSPGDPPHVPPCRAEIIPRRPFIHPLFSHHSLSTPQRDACMGTWGKDCGERWLPGFDLMEDGGDLVVLKILTKTVVEKRSLLFFSPLLLYYTGIILPAADSSSGTI